MLVRYDYVQIRLLCPICKKITKQSRMYSSPYSLKYHLTTYHNKQDEIESSITINEVKQIARTIDRAIEFNMLFDL